jgi:hypothetical protein
MVLKKIYSRIKLEMDVQLKMVFKILNYTWLCLENKNENVRKNEHFY